MSLRHLGADRPRWRGVRFLCYHQVVKDLSTVRPAKRAFALTTEEFGAHLEYLKTNCSVISMPEATELIELGKAGKGKFICLTFDDGYLDNYTVAWPILKSFGFSAHFFLVSRFLNQVFADTGDDRLFPRQYLDDSSACALIREGATVGVHGATHELYTSLADVDLVVQLGECRDRLVSLGSKPIDTLAFTSGVFDRRVCRLAAESGFRWQFCLGLGSVKRRRSNGLCPRTAIRDHDVAGQLRMIAGAYDWRRYLSPFKKAWRSFRSRAVWARDGG